MSLSPHFQRSEFALTAPMPEEAVVPYCNLCNWILEPTRTHFQSAIVITSGYRTAASNCSANGQLNSEHMATADFCAADFKVLNLNGDMRPVFDWMRNSQELPWHQLILEHEPNGHTIIHVSWNRLKPGVRSCKEGDTNNAGPYTDIACVTYHPTQSLPGVEESIT